jgi:hypothetical protein
MTQPMNIAINVEGHVLITMMVDLAVLPKLLGTAAAPQLVAADHRSTAATKEQMEELLTRIDSKSVDFLKAIARSRNGSVTWLKMRQIFRIRAKSDWNSYSGSYGKGITRAFRHILKSKTARLIWWNDDEWTDETDSFRVHMDGPALRSLREAFGF